jgi:hypothetical protein
MKALGFFAAGVVTATTTGLILIEFWLHLVEHNAYRKGTR